MTLTDIMIGAAALWLLFVLSGLPGQRGQPSADAGAEMTSAAIAPRGGADIALYSVWEPDMPRPRYVTPPLPETDATITGATILENTCAILGSAPVRASEVPQALSLTDVTVPPGGRLSVSSLDGSGLIVMQEGWLELTAWEGDTRIFRAPLTASPAPRDEDRLLTLAPGDRIAFGSGAGLTLQNSSEHPAQLLSAMVTIVPGQAA